ncbi:MAG: hypothetical protein U0003_04415 [Vampirovibrionales bacterium]
MLSSLLHALLTPQASSAAGVVPSSANRGRLGNAPSQATWGYDPMPDSMTASELAGLTGVAPVLPSSPFTSVLSSSPAGGGASLLTKALPKDYGRNKPLPQPAFFGYHGDKPLYAGSKLYISC